MVRLWGLGEMSEWRGSEGEKGGGRGRRVRRVEDLREGDERVVVRGRYQENDRDFLRRRSIVGEKRV